MCGREPAHGSEEHERGPEHQVAAAGTGCPHSSPSGAEWRAEWDSSHDDADVGVHLSRAALPARAWHGMPRAPWA